MFLEHDELGGFGVSGHSAGSHENAAHFVPPPVTDFSSSLKEEVDEINEAAPGVTDAMPSSTSSATVGNKNYVNDEHKIMTMNGGRGQILYLPIL